MSSPPVLQKRMQPIDMPFGWAVGDSGGPSEPDAPRERQFWGGVFGLLENIVTVRSTVTANTHADNRRLFSAVYRRSLLAGTHLHICKTVRNSDMRCKTNKQ